MVESETPISGGRFHVNASRTYVPPYFDGTVNISIVSSVEEIRRISGLMEDLGPPDSDIDREIQQAQEEVNVIIRREGRYNGIHPINEYGVVLPEKIRKKYIEKEKAKRESLREVTISRLDLIDKETF